MKGKGPFGEKERCTAMVCCQKQGSNKNEEKFQTERKHGSGTEGGMYREVRKLEVKIKI